MSTAARQGLEDKRIRLGAFCKAVARELCDPPASRGFCTRSDDGPFAAAPLPQTDRNRCHELHALPRPQRDILSPRPTRCGRAAALRRCPRHPWPAS